MLLSLILVQMIKYDICSSIGVFQFLFKLIIVHLIFILDCNFFLIDHQSWLHLLIHHFCTILQLIILVLLRRLNGYVFIDSVAFVDRNVVGSVGNLN